MRPGEVCILRPCDIDMSGDVWWYKPEHHKTAHQDKDRVIAIGPKAQDVLKLFLPANSLDYYFNPSRVIAESRARRAALRKTPRWPSHEARNRRKRKAKPVWSPGVCYKVHSYEVNIERACDKAFPLPAHLAQGKDESWVYWQGRLTEEQQAEVKKWRKEHRWHPNQLRHSFATNVRRAHGLEAAQVLLGHSRADVTQIYAERNLSLASEIAKAVG
jgi:integrase